VASHVNDRSGIEVPFKVKAVAYAKQAVIYRKRCKRRGFYRLQRGSYIRSINLHVC